MNALLTGGLTLIDLCWKPTPVLHESTNDINPAVPRCVVQRCPAVIVLLARAFGEEVGGRFGKRGEIKRERERERERERNR
jgi:hypothetical protein